MFFSFFAGDVRRSKREPDRHFLFVKNLRMNGVLPLLTFYDLLTHTRTVFSVLRGICTYDDLGSKIVGNYMANRKHMYKLGLFLIIKPTRCTNFSNLFL